MFQHLPGFDPAAAMLHLVASNMDHSCCFSRNGTFVHTNSALRQATEFTNEELVGQSFLAFIHPHDREDVTATLGSWWLSLGARPVIARFARKGGGYRWLEWRPFAQASDDIFCATVRDATEDRRIRALSEELETISEVGTWEIDLDTELLYWSPVTFLIHELDPGSYTPKIEDGLSFYPEEAQADIRRAVSALMTKGERFDLELPFLTAKGRRIWVQSTAAAEVIGGRISRVYGTFRDITAKRAQREHLLRLTSVIEQAKTAVILCGIDQRIEWINPAFEALSGYSLDEAIGQSLAALVEFEKTDPVIVQAARAAMDDVREFTGQFFSRSKDGREYWTDHKIQPLMDTNGRHTGFMAVIEDITDRMTAEALRLKAEDDVRRAEEGLRSAVEVLPDAFALFDSEDRLVVFNERYRDSASLSAPALVQGARFEDIVRAGLARGLYVDAIGREDDWLVERIASHRTAVGAQEYRLANNRWVRVVEQKTPSGGRVALEIDITELKAREWRLSEIIRGTNVGTWEWNVLTGETVFNERWAEIVGYRLDELQPTTIETWLRFGHPDDLEVSSRELERHFRGESQFYDVSVRMRHRDGHWVWVLDRGRVASWTPDGKPLWMFGTHQDISASKRSQEELVQTLARAEQATAAKSAFLATMSHEIRTPLNGVLGMAELLDETLQDPEQRMMVRTIRDSGEVLLSVINDILDFSKIEAGKLDLETIAFTPQEVAGKITSLHELKAAEGNLELSVLVSTGANVPRIGDPNRILQIAHNLVGNAIKFTRSGRITVTLTCKPKNPLVLQVADTGIGMTPEHVERLFTAFEQADSSTTRNFGGTGLGMSIVRSLVEMMRGEIKVESTIGEGTCVRVTLPLPVGVPEAGQSEAPRAKQLEPPTGLRILVVDDSSTNRRVLKSMLMRFGCETTLAESGREAIALRASGAFDLLMIDIHMPDLDGVSTLAEIRAQERRSGTERVPALAVTANAMVHQIAAYIEGGFDGHISKPLNLETLRDALLRHAPVGQDQPPVPR